MDRVLRCDRTRFPGARCDRPPPRQAAVSSRARNGQAKRARTRRRCSTGCCRCRSIRACPSRSRTWSSPLREASWHDRGVEGEDPGPERRLVSCRRATAGRRASSAARRCSTRDGQGVWSESEFVARSRTPAHDIGRRGARSGAGTRAHDRRMSDRPRAAGPRPRLRRRHARARSARARLRSPGLDRHPAPRASRSSTAPWTRARRTRSCSWSTTCCVCRSPRSASGR